MTFFPALFLWRLFFVTDNSDLHISYGPKRTVIGLYNSKKNAGNGDWKVSAGHNLPDVCGLPAFPEFGTIT